MKDQQINNFNKGMSKDLGHTMPQQGFYIDGKNIRIMSDGSSSETAVVVSVDGNQKKITLLYTTEEIVSTTGEGQFTMIEILPGEDVNPFILGYTYIRETLIVFATIPQAFMPAGLNSVGIIYTIDLNTFTSELIFDSPELNFNINNPIEAIGRFESETIQRIYWTDNLNPVRTLNIKSDLSELEDIENINLSPKVAFNKLNIEDVETGGNLSAGMYQYLYRLKSSSGAQTRFSQPSNFVHVVDGGLYWDYTEDPENQSEYNGGTPGEATDKKVIINFTDLDSSYDIVEIAAIYRSTQEGFTSVSIIKQTSITENGEATITHSSNTDDIPISIEEATAFNQSFDSVKTISEKDNRLFFGNVKQKSASLLFNATSKRYLRSGETVYTPYKPNSAVITSDHTEDINPYNNLNNWWDDPNSMYKYQSNGLTIGGTGEYVDFKFTKEIIQGNTLNNTSEVFPYISGNLNNDYKSPVVTEKFKGYQRDEVYRFGIVLYDKVGNPGFVNWIGDIRFPAVEDVDKDGVAGIYNYSIAQTNQTDSGANYAQNFDDPSHVEMYNAYTITGNQVPGNVSSLAPIETTQMSTDAGISPVNNLYALGIEFKLKNIPAELKNLVGGYSFVRVKRTKNDKSTLAVGALTNYFHYYDNSTLNNDSSNWFASANRNLSYLTSQGSGNEDDDHKGIPITNAFSVSSPETDFNTNYLSSAETGFSMQGDYNTAYSVRVLGSIWANANFNVSGDDRVYSLAYGCHSVRSNISRIKEEDQHYRISSVIKFCKEHGAGEGLSDSAIETEFSFTALTGQAASSDAEIGDFRGAWNIITDYTVSDNTLNLMKASVCEKSLFVISKWSMYWNDYLKNANELYADDDYNGNEYDKLLVAIKNNNVHLTRYGGSDTSARASSVYISTGHFKKITDITFTSAETPAYEKVFGGDTYVTMYDLTKARKASSDQGDITYPAESIDNHRCINMAFPVETTINTTLRGGYHFANKTDFSADSLTPLNEFKLNPTYSSENDIFSYTASPEIFNDVTEYSNRIAFSNVKINNSNIDGWRIVLPGSYADLDGNSGNLNKLIVYNDAMFYLQDTAFGVLSINPVSTVKDQDSNSIVLGIGKKVIQKHKNISTYTGAKDNRHVVVGQSGIYWLDMNTKKAYHYNKKGMNPISDTKLLKSYFNNLDINPSTTCLGYDYINNEVLYSTGEETIVYNEFTSSFTSTYSFNTQMFISLPNKLMSIQNTEDQKGFIYEHNVGSVANWYGQDQTSEIEFVVNKHPIYTKVFDNLEWYSESGGATTDNVKELIITDSSNAVTVNTEDEDNVNYFPYKVIKEKMTKMPVPRTTANYRFRDTYLKIRLVAGKTSKIMLHYVKTLFRISRR